MSLSALCTRCGLCCDGSLFTHVPLEPTEVAAPALRVLDVVRLKDGSPGLRQCCTALKGRACTVYTERPGICRSFGCQLFKDLAGQKLSPGEAFALVDQAHALLAALEQHLAPDTDTPPSPVIQRARFADFTEGGGLSPEAQAAKGVVEEFLDRHFRGGPRSFEGL